MAHYGDRLKEPAPGDQGTYNIERKKTYKRTPPHTTPPYWFSESEGLGNLCKKETQRWGEKPKGVFFSRNRGTQRGESGGGEQKNRKEFKLRKVRNRRKKR